MGGNCGESVRDETRLTYTQLKRLLPTLAGLYAPTLAGLLLVALVSSQTGVPLWKFIGDPSTITNTHPFVGVLSNVGAVL